jgi:hypothetical protein
MAEPRISTTNPDWSSLEEDIGKIMFDNVRAHRVVPNLADFLLTQAEASAFAKLVLSNTKPMDMPYLSVGINGLSHDRLITWSRTSSFDAPHNNDGVVIQVLGNGGVEISREGHWPFAAFLVSYRLDHTGNIRQAKCLISDNQSDPNKEL